MSSITEAIAILEREQQRIAISLGMLRDAVAPSTNGHTDTKNSGVYINGNANGGGNGAARLTKDGRVDRRYQPWTEDRRARTMRSLLKAVRRRRLSPTAR